MVKFFFFHCEWAFSSVQLLSRARLFATPWTTARQASLSITSSQSLLKFMSIKLVMPCNCLTLCHPLLLLPSIFPSIRVFPNESTLHIRWPKHWSFSCSISPSNEHSGLISFRMDWLDLLAVQGTLKSLLQHHNLFIFLNFFLNFIYLFIFFVVDFVIHWNETAMGLHVFPIPIPPPTSLSTRSL